MYCKDFKRKNLNQITLFKLIQLFFILLLTILFACSPKTSDQEKVDNLTDNDISLCGAYAGLEEMCWTDSNGKKKCYIDPATPERKWYHLGYLKIRDDSVFLDQNPIHIGENNDTLWSASDGAFYYYSGICERKDSIVEFNLKELFCDYCPHEIKIKPDGTREIIKRTKQLKGYITDKGIIINGYLYARMKNDEDLISEHHAPF